MKYEGIKKADIVLTETTDTVKVKVKAKDIEKTKSQKGGRRLLKTLLFQLITAVVIGGLYYGVTKINNSIAERITGEVRRAIQYNIGYEQEEDKEVLVDKIIESITGAQNSSAEQSYLSAATPFDCRFAAAAPVNLKPEQRYMAAANLTTAISGAINYCLPDSEL